MKREFDLAEAAKQYRTGDIIAFGSHKTECVVAGQEPGEGLGTSRRMVSFMEAARGDSPVLQRALYATPEQIKRLWELATDKGPLTDDELSRRVIQMLVGLPEVS